jgi:hypothetical protein
VNTIYRKLEWSHSERHLDTARFQAPYHRATRAWGGRKSGLFRFAATSGKGPTDTGRPFYQGYLLSRKTHSKPSADYHEIVNSVEIAIRSDGIPWSALRVIGDVGSSAGNIPVDAIERLQTPDVVVVLLESEIPGRAKR